MKERKQQQQKNIIIINTTELFRSAPMHVNYPCISHYLEKIDEQRRNVPKLLENLTITYYIT